MKAKLKKLFNNPVFNIILVILLSGFVLWLTLRKNGEDIIPMLRNADKHILLLLVLIMIFERFVSGWGIAQQCKVTNKSYTVKQGVVNAYTASLFNNITPSASGGQFAQLYVFRRQGMTVPSAVSVLWLNFIIYQSTMSVVVMILLGLKFTYFYTRYSQLFLFVILGFIMNSAVIFGLWALIRFPRFYRWLTTTGLSIGAKIHLIKDREKAKDSIDSQLTHFDHDVGVLNQNRKMIVLVVISHIIRLLIIYSVPFISAIALHIPVSFSVYLDTVALASFVAMINAFVPSPGSAGGTEATFILMFSTIFGTINASSIMILWRLATYYLQTIIGAFIFIIEKMRPIVINDNIQDIPEK